MFPSFQPFWIRSLEKSRYFTATNTGYNSQIPAHFTRVAAQERENWLALLQEQGQFGQNQFSQFSELTRSIYAGSEPTGQFWQMVSALSDVKGAILVISRPKANGLSVYFCQLPKKDNNKYAILIVRENI